MADPVHVVCPHCHVANRVPAPRLSESPACGRCHRPLPTGQPAQSIPTLALFRGGREDARQAGAMAAQDLVRWVRERMG